MTTPNILYEKAEAFVFSHDDWVETISLATQPEDQFGRITIEDRHWFFGEGKFKGASQEFLKIGFRELEAQM